MVKQVRKVFSDRGQSCGLVDDKMNVVAGTPLDEQSVWFGFLRDEYDVLCPDCGGYILDINGTCTCQEGE